MNSFFYPSPIWQNNGIAIARILVGVALVYHGWETFNSTIMNEYFKWDMFKDSVAAKIFVYAGKISELISGLLLLLGLFTRVACIILICTMAYIAFFVGSGKIWYEDQYPFLFVIIGFIFILTGPGALSLDKRLFKKKI